MHKDGDLENRVRVDVYQLNLIVMQETTEEFIGQEVKSAFEEGS
jgi:hypothetical protein